MEWWWQCAGGGDGAGGEMGSGIENSCTRRLSRYMSR